MAFSMYQSLRTVPSDLDEASRGFRLTAWQRFWRLDVPFAVPGLVWNTMMSMSGGWFFVVAAEAVTVGDVTLKLPGIGSYVATAIDQRDLRAVIYAILAMLVVILLYDQLLFRPLVAWSAKFRFETTQTEAPEDPWVLAALRRTRLLRLAADAVGDLFARFTGARLSFSSRLRPQRPARPSRLVDALFLAAVVLVAGAALYRVVTFCSASLAWSDLGTALLFGLYTLIRVVVLMVIATLVWVPIGVWLGLTPRLARRAQPVVQFMAAFPANLFFPIFVIAIVRWHLNAEVWLSPLMVLGAQWYILFNVIAGAAAFPGDLREAARNFRVGGWLWWRRVILPGIFPYFVTGAITASGGAWNAAILAEVASWGRTKLTAQGLGAYIAEATDKGNTAKVVLGVIVMSAFVLTFNRVLWRPLFTYSSRRLTL